MNWRRRFDDPIALPDGRTVKTLADARAALERAGDSDAPARARDVLQKAAEHGGPFLFIARISVAKALLGDDPPIGEPRLTKAEQFKARRAEYLRRRKSPMA